MTFIDPVRVGRLLTRSLIKSWFYVAILIAGALVSNTANARAYNDYHERRPIHLLTRQPVHVLARQAAHAMAARPARFSRRTVHFITWRATRFVQRRPTLTTMRTARMDRPAPHMQQAVIAEAMRYLGDGNVTGMRGAWCADYASMVLRHTGHRPLANRMASSAFAYGPRVSQPQPGDLMVISSRAGYAQHVGFFAGWDHGQALMVSGNWGHRVARAAVYRGAVAAFIRV